MPTFAEDWSKAKAAFTATTQAKKPSASFLGVFNKGPGISAALKDADKAKNAGELNSAMKAFKTAFDAYIITLDKAAKDPKVTAAADKPTYVAAVAKLKKDLQAIHDRAGAVAENIVGANKKDAVNTADLKGKVDAYEAALPQISKMESARKTYENNRAELAQSTSVFIKEFGKRAQELKSTTMPNGTLNDFLKDPAAKKLYDEAKTRYENLGKMWAIYEASYNAAVKLQSELPDEYQSKLDDLVDKLPAPASFDNLVTTQLNKTVAELKAAAGGDAAEAAEAMLNPRVLVVRSKELADLKALVLTHTAAAIKAKGTPQAKTSLDNAMKALDQMEPIVNKVRSAYESQKSSVSKSKDAKDIMLRLNQIAAHHKEALTAVQNAQK